MNGIGYGNGIACPVDVVETILHRWKTRMNPGLNGIVHDT